MRAIFSDVHGNLEALQAVLTEVSRQQVTSVYNLGDTMGCGPNPIECLDLAMEMEVVLLGIFDHGVLFDTDGFGPSAEQSVFWARKLLESSVEEPAVRQRRCTFLAGLSPSHREGDVLYVHGSPRNQLGEYVFPEDIDNEPKMRAISKRFDQVCFTGNTGVPGVFVQRGPGRWEFFGPEDCVGGFPVVGPRVLCNVGAVGWPRDGDWRACYVLFDGEAIWFRRVEYDVEATVRKIDAIPMLSNIYGNWLREGR
jgi:hypothetical protein